MLWALDPIEGAKARSQKRGSPLYRLFSGRYLRWPILLSPLLWGLGVYLTTATVLDIVWPSSWTVALATSLSLLLSGAFMAYLLRALLRSQEELAYMARHDSLTGLLNRHYFLERMRQHVQHSMKAKKPCALLFCDIDGFKAVNDFMGHPRGDAVLVWIASTIKRIVPRPAVVGRVGGDEIAVLLPGASSFNAHNVAKSIIHAISSHNGIVPQALSVSIGIALSPKHGSTAEELLSKADMAMHNAKARGGGCYDEWAGSLGYIWSNGPTSVRRLEAALREGRLLLYFQPIVRLKDKSVSACEVLLRLREGNRVVGPGEFLQVAEASGLIRELDRWVVENALRSYWSLKAKLGVEGSFRLHINLSPITLADERTATWVGSALTASEVDPNNVVLEVTETVGGVNMEAMRRIMISLSALGCRFALDDFGAGHSNIFRLANLPLQMVKMDGFLSRAAKENIAGRILLEATINGVKRLGLETVAEQIEDNGETLRILQDIGVDYAQGYAFGYPQPIS